MSWPLALAPWLAACPTEPPREEPAATLPSSSIPAASLPRRPAPRPPKPKPRAEPTTPTAAGDLGTRPDGVGLAAGDAAPDFALEAHSRGTHGLDQLLARGEVLLVFYQGGWSPFCNFQIRELSVHHQELRERGVAVAMVSVDALDKIQETAAAFGVPFPLLSDPDLRAHRAYRVAREIDAEAFAALRDKGTDLESWSQKQHHQIAIASMFFIGKDKRIRWAHASRDEKTRPSIDALLTVIDELRAKR